MKKKLIIFGGSFDPVHKGHIKIALTAYNKLKADKVFFVPCNNHPSNKSISADSNNRIDMLKLAIENYDFFEICDYEIKNKDKISYTINTINYFLQNYSNSEIYLLIGTDQLINFEKWKDYQEILKKAKLICYKRIIENSESLKNIKIKYKKIGLFLINTSSSELRIKPNKRYLNKKVLNYINDHGLYAIQQLKEVMSEYRLKHSIEVANIAKNLTLKHKLHILTNKAYVAGIYHDYAKELDEHSTLKYAKKLKIKNFVSWKVLHGPVGAYLVNKKFFINDYQVLLAIKNHVIPEDFSTLTKIVYIADKIATRHDSYKNNELSSWKELANINIDKCFKTIFNYYQNKGAK